MNFIDYTYKAYVEAEKSMLVNVIKELDSLESSQQQSYAQKALSPKANNYNNYEYMQPPTPTA